MRELSFGNLKDGKIGSFHRPVGWNRFNKVLKTCERIPNKELAKLIIKAKGGCQVSKDKIVRSCLKMVVAIAKKYIIQNKVQSFDLMDMIQVGCEGILRAIENYEERDSCSFPSYVVYYIRGRILFHLPFRDLIKRPIPLKNNAEVEVISTSTVLEDDIYTELLADNIPDAVTNMIDKQHTMESLRVDLDKILSRLTKREQDVIRLVFLCGQSLDDVGYGLNITSEKARQIKNKAITKLRDNFEHSKNFYIIKEYFYLFTNSDGFANYGTDVNEQIKLADTIYKSKESGEIPPPQAQLKAIHQPKPQTTLPTKYIQGKSSIKKTKPVDSYSTTKNNTDLCIVPPPITNVNANRKFQLDKIGIIEALKSFAEHNQCPVTTIKIMMFKNEAGAIQFNEYINGKFNRILNVKTDILNIHKWDFLQVEFKVGLVFNVVLNAIMEKLYIKHNSCDKTEVRILFYIKREEQTLPYIQYYKEGDLTGGQYLTWDELKEIF
jgi:RNA polymerase primary sigma factor